MPFTAPLKVVVPPVMPVILTERAAVWIVPAVADGGRAAADVERVVRLRQRKRASH